MNYFNHNDAKGRDARIRLELHQRERAKQQDFDGTLFMSKYELMARCTESLVLSGRLSIGKPRRWSSAGMQLQNIPRNSEGC